MIPNPINAAEEVRRVYWDGNIPVDPVRIAKSMGIEVLNAALTERVSGAIIKKQGRDAIIFLAEGDSTQRKRFTSAHELGHYYQRSGEEKFE